MRIVALHPAIVQYFTITPYCALFHKWRLLIMIQKESDHCHGKNKVFLVGSFGYSSSQRTNRPFLICESI